MRRMEVRGRDFQIFGTVEIPDKPTDHAKWEYGDRVTLTHESDHSYGVRVKIVLTIRTAGNTVDITDEMYAEAENNPAAKEFIRQQHERAVRERYLALDAGDTPPEYFKFIPGFKPV